MRIVHLIPSFDVGGAELLAIRLCSEIKRQNNGFEVFLVSMYDPIPTVVYQEALNCGAEVVTLGKKRGFDARMPYRIGSFLRSVKPDIVHTHLVCLAYTFFPCLFLGGFSKFHTFHSIASRENPLIVRFIQNMAIRMMSWKPVALTRAIQSTVYDLYGIRAFIVSNGVPVDSRIMGRSKLELRLECGLPEEGFFIISVGRLSREKNHILLIEVFETIAEGNPDCHMLFVGDDHQDGSHRRLLEERVTRLPADLSARVHFLGHRKDVASLLGASDMFVMASEWEGQPLTLLEAMGYGLPVVCTSVGGIPDVIRDGVNGLLVPPGNGEALGLAIKSLMVDRELAGRLALGAMEEFSRKYHISHTAAQYLTLYRAAVRGNA